MGKVFHQRNLTWTWCKRIGCGRGALLPGIPACMQCSGYDPRSTDPSKQQPPAKRTSAKGFTP